MTRVVLYFLYLICVCLLGYHCETTNGSTISAQEEDAGIVLTSVLVEQMSEIKGMLGRPEYARSYQKLIEQADEALDRGPYSVMQKTTLPPSGDKHDYISLGPYWWPDPDRDDGLPWIRRDGEVNPMTREGNTDYVIKNNFFKDIQILGLAYFYSGDRQYADHAIELLKVWFLDPATKMNPNFNFAQGIPGKNTGRGIGIIEWAGVTDIITTIEILEGHQLIDDAMSEQLRLWFSDFVDWLQTSENGIFERNTKNNHGTWYDVQLVAMLLYLDRVPEAKKILELVKTERIDRQISSDGSQPHELARTKSLSYSVMNLRGFTQLAFYGSRTGVDLWTYESQEGGGIMRAFEFLKPYAKKQKVWEYPQITGVEKAERELLDLFARAGSWFDIPEYCEMGMEKNQAKTSLLYSCR